MKSPKPTSAEPLSDRHERFVHEYLIDQNASAAAGRAGYSANTKGTHAALMMKNPAVRAYSNWGTDHHFREIHPGIAACSR